MTRFALAVLAVLASAGLAPAGLMPTWGYKVYTDFAPSPIVSQGFGLPATATATVSAADIEAALYPHTGDRSPLDSIQGGTHYQQVIAGSLGVMFVNGTPSYYDSPDLPVYSRTFDTVGWRVTRDWTKTGDTWAVSGETFDGFGPWFGDNYAGAPSAEGQRYVWDRYDVKLERDGSLTLDMTPDVANPRFVPEPGTLTVAGACGIGLLAAWWRRKKANGAA